MNTDRPLLLEKFQTMERIRNIRLKANGQQYGLDVALKYPGEAECYAFNNKSYSARDRKRDEYRLTESPVRVRVVIRGQELDHPVSCEFLLHNDDQGFRLSDLTQENAP